MSNKELSELQSELESLKEKNKQAEVNLLMKQDISRDKVEEVGKLLMAVNNLAQQCYLPEFGPLESMSVLTMMDMVKVTSSCTELPICIQIIQSNWNNKQDYFHYSVQS
ncbi:hypothetical protein XENOCAPTIV_021299 [Xenoophorus captivus]|uniref:Uncharacterized protein n=1 Tax=Xenoophorus captivus TaxID=1517983 RepID=A0ABV0QMG7_9TELE